LAEFIEARESLWAAGNNDARLSGSGGFNRVGLIAEIPDMAAFQEFMQTEAAADAMKADGVRPETLLVLDEG
jgi:hypothetical protein